MILKDGYAYGSASGCETRSYSGSTVAQTWRVRSDRASKPRPPLDSAALERLALFYAGRYATTRAKLTAYLIRKVRERGWEEEAPPPIARLIERFAELGYVNDQAFATARAGALQRRGYGARRIDQALHAAGIGEEDGAEAKALSIEGAWDAALRFAQRKRIGPYASELPDRAQKQKAFAAMMRAGHGMDVTRRIIDAAPGIIPQSRDM
jgi:regulatory protein